MGMVEMAILGFPVSESRAQKLCESRSGRPGFPVPNSPHGFCGRKATLNWLVQFRAQELCESRGGLSGFPVPNKPDGFCGRKATLNLAIFTAQELCVKVEVAVLDEVAVRNSPYIPCGR